MILWRLLGNILFVVLYPFIALYLNRNERVRVIITCGDTVLLVQHWLRNRVWETPGGGLHKGEDQATAACRELLEELALQVSPNELAYMGTRQYVAGLMNFPAHYYRLQLPDRSVAFRLQKTELVAVNWIPLADADAYPIPRATKAVLREIS